VVEVRRGDVVLCDLYAVFGTEQAGVRPAIMVPCTTKIRKSLLPSHVFLPAGSGGSL